MKYLCLIYIDERTLDRLSADEYAAVEAACVDLEERLKRSNSLIAAEALQPTRDATTVRVRNGRPSITDGPFDETREQLSGYFLIEARDLNDAIRLAAQIPPARLGCVEVRPVRELHWSGSTPTAHRDQRASLDCC